MSLTPDMVIAKAVELRDQLKALDEKQSAERRPYTEALERIEAWLLNHLNESKAESIRTGAGTAFKSTTLSATVEPDGGWDSFLSWVIRHPLERALAAIEGGHGEHEAAIAFLSSPQFGFLLRGVNKTAVKEMMEADGGRTPPGIKTALVTKVNIRRA